MYHRTIKWAPISNGWEGKSVEKRTSHPTPHTVVLEDGRATANRLTSCQKYGTQLNFITRKGRHLRRPSPIMCAISIPPSFLTPSLTISLLSHISTPTPFHAYIVNIEDKQQKPPM